MRRKKKKREKVKIAKERYHSTRASSYANDSTCKHGDDFIVEQRLFDENSVRYQNSLKNLNLNARAMRATKVNYRLSKFEILSI